MKTASELVKTRYEDVATVAPKEDVPVSGEIQGAQSMENRGVAEQILGKIAPARQTSGPRTEKLQVMVSKALLERIKVAAEERGLPKSTFVNDILEELLR